MIERRTVLDQTEPSCRTGVLGVKIAFLLIEDGIVTGSNWHRTAIPVYADPIQQMAAVNTHLTSMQPPMPPVSQADIDFITQCHALLVQRCETIG